MKNDPFLSFIPQYPDLVAVSFRYFTGCVHFLISKYHQYSQLAVVMNLTLQKNLFEFTFQISELCFEAVKKLFKQDKLGYASLGVVKVISGLVRGRNYDVRPEVRVFLLYYTISFCQWFKKNLKVKISAAAGYRQAEFPLSVRIEAAWEWAEPED